MATAAPAPETLAPQTPAEAPTPPAGCTFDAGNWAILARHWYPVATLEEVTQGPVKARLLDQPLVVYRAGGELVVAPDLCPHRGVPLSLGHQGEKGVVCPYHGLTFGAKGHCVHVPAQPARDISPRFHLKTFPAIARYGLIWTCLAPDAQETASGQPAAGAIIDLPHADEEGFQHIVCPPFDIKGYAGRQLEGFLDVAHFAFIHTATFADPENAAVPDYRPRQTPFGFEAEYWSTVGNYPHSSGLAPEGFRWLRHFRCQAPFTATLEVHFPGSHRLVILNAASPVSARATRLFVPILRNYDTHLPVADVHAFNLAVFAEDAAMVEAQSPAHVPLDPTAEAHLPADMSSMFYRRALKEMGLTG